MEESEYVKLLDKAYASLPAVLYKKERFEIPEVRGKLIKSRTLITNFRDIAKHFARTEEHFFTFMLKDLGVRGEHNQRGELTLHSRFQPAMLNRSVQKYFQSYVQCPHCHSPDTVIGEDGVSLRCKACGHETRVQRV
ncbi:translation initiation factor IF-2 subunit beta [Candidatus Woesearchaeota archaeon]|nr:translation initiation factor IF-2 subunit beta [Nanoarchaeota archaeon]MCB9370167.1 translation initiation factor IF-2 subunit beta [Candidatus Woesearchaeota archaeon]USN44697.1 MAG: translation initiation factor IF-2 subunit beta [Candidatus Woesearchaeota archaeon]